MKNFSNETAKKILANEISVETLLLQYPEYKQEVLEELHVLRSNKNNSNIVQAIMDKYTSSAKLATNQIKKSRWNGKTIDAFLPNIIKARFAIYLLEQLNIAASSNTPGKSVRFNWWDGTILQKLLFHKGFERKPVSLGLFNVFWRLVIHKHILMPLVNKKGIYCFYSKPLLHVLEALIGNQTCLEIAAGDGTLTKFLNNRGVKCIATDDYSWQHYITYPSFVQKADAKAALHAYNPKVVLCSWPVPNNTYEKHVFRHKSVDLYIVIGTNNPAITGDHETYNHLKDFTMEINEHLSSMLLPPSAENAVYLFKRIK